ncbi:uncharacterized protein LOC119302937 [Triticum dicoccoides]|uniref:uncharacterized protein LOC119302937 n=1 Tax=Triticum dicoccoides TaxID=85692 RepID=UPI00188DFFD7|nr:uncharacterized protein LOC119302937 [Triticum dicoccoides]
MATRQLRSPEQRAHGRCPARSSVERSSGDVTTQRWGISPAAAAASFWWRRRRPRHRGQATRACVSTAAAAATSFHAPSRRAAAFRPWRARTAAAVRTPKAGVIWLLLDGGGRGGILQVQYFTLDDSSVLVKCTTGHVKVNGDGSSSIFCRGID